MKKILILMLVALMIVSLVACDDSTVETPSTDGTTTAADTTTAAPSQGLAAPEWSNMLSAANFENYTVTYTGRMTVVEENVTSDVNQIVRVAGGRMELVIFMSDEDSSDEEFFSDVYEGDIAKSQKQELEQVFLLMLSKRDAFKYDAESDTYLVTETITIEETMVGISYIDGIPQEFDCPTVIEMRNGEVSVSEDGKLMKFTCDYSQTMDLHGQLTTIIGHTTWTFSDYGTTVID